MSENNYELNLYEFVDSNGVPRENIIVVKSTAFVVKFSCSQVVSLTNCVGEASLYYDTDENKRIDTPAEPPVSCRVLPNKESFSSTIDVEFTIRVLTSQHHSAFKLKLILKTIIGKELSCWIRPIYCVSKQTQVEKTQLKLTQPKTPRKRSSSGGAALKSQPTSSFLPSPTVNSENMLEYMKEFCQLLRVVNSKLDRQQQQIDTLVSIVTQTQINSNDEERFAKFQKVDPNNNLESSQSELWEFSDFASESDGLPVPSDI